MIAFQLFEYEKKWPPIATAPMMRGSLVQRQRLSGQAVRTKLSGENGPRSVPRAQRVLWRIERGGPQSAYWKDIRYTNEPFH